MNEQKLIDSLTARAEDDARRFREQHPDDTPTERWIENSFTAALPLAKDAAGVEVGPERDADLFSVYRSAIASRVGERVSPRDASDDLTPQPTPGEN